MNKFSNLLKINILLVIILFSLSLSGTNQLNNPKYFREILNSKQELFSDTFRILRKFVKKPIQLHQSFSFKISESVFFIKSIPFFPIMINDNYLDYISIANDSVIIYNKGDNKTLFSLNQKNKKFVVNGISFLPESEMMLEKVYWDNVVKDSVYSINVKEIGPLISDVPHLCRINFSKKYGFLKLIYTNAWSEKDFIESYNRNLYYMKRKN